MPNIYVIKWVDSSSHNIGWHDDDDFELVGITTIGFVVSEDDEKVVVSHCYTDNDFHYDAFIIPRGCIRSLDVISISDEDKVEE